MRQCFCTLLAVFLLLPVFSVSAQTPPCGSIITPADFWYEGDSEVVEPVGDCANPFNKTEPLTGFSINNVPVADGAQIAIPVEGVVIYGFDGDGPYRGEQNLYYKHSGADFVAQNVHYKEPERSEIVILIDQFFNGQTDLVDRYTEIYFANDLSVYFQDENYEFLVDPMLGRRTFDVYNEVNEFVSNHLVYKRTPLTPGTYTIVDYQGSGGGPVMSVRPSFIERVLAMIIPAAHAESAVTSKALTFTLVGPAPEPTGASSVLFLPGIQASRLYIDGVLGTENQLWETNGNIDVKKLEMSGDGRSVNSVYTRDIPGEVYYGYASIYGGFMQYMDELVATGTIKAWEPFAYDWRYSVDDIANNGTQYQAEIKHAVDTIEQLASDSYTGKVTIIGHSNGGLLAKAVMMQLATLGKSNLVDTVVFLASPQLGTPKAVGSILHGYDQELGKGFIVDDAVAREVMKNMPGAYGLVPSEKYFAVATSTIIRFDNSTTTQAFRTAYGTTIDSLTELTQFMTGLGDGRPEAVTLDQAMLANSSLLQKELQLHNTLDNWIAPAGVKVVEVVGTGLDTVNGFEYRGYTERVCSLLGFLSCEVKTMYKPVPLITQRGDKTVVGESAEGYVGEKEQYFIDLKKVADIRKDEAVQHFDITENPSIQQLLKNILTATTTAVDFITQVPQAVVTDRIMLGTHSPVSLEVKDAQGRRAGRGLVNGISVPTEEIPGSSYFEIGSSTYVIVPDGIKYNVTMRGTGQGGLTFSVDSLKGELQRPIVAMRVATVTPSTTMTVSYTNTELGNISVDQNGDGVIDQVLTPQGIEVTPKVTYATLKSTLQTLALSTLRKAALLLLEATAETLDKNPKLAVLETLTLNQLEALLVTYQKNKWITQIDLANLKVIISKLK